MMGSGSSKDSKDSAVARGTRVVSAIRIIKKGLVGAGRKICQRTASLFFTATSNLFLPPELRFLSAGFMEGVRVYKD